MAYRVVMPRLGWSMEKGRLVEWLKKDGDAVQVGEILFTVESDKALQEVEALESGILRLAPSSPPPGTEMPVGALLGYLLKPGEEMPAADADSEPGPADVCARETLAVAAESIARQVGALASPVSGSEAGHKAAISPRARRVARELGLDWSGMRGSGRTGRIVERDIRRAAREASEQAIMAPGTPRPLGEAIWGSKSMVGEPGARPASVTLHSVADATELVALAERLTSTWAAGALLAPASLCLVCKLVGLALQEHPLLNASLQDGRIVLHRSVHLTVAMKGEGVLRWPVIHDVPHLSVQRIAEEASRLQESVRGGGLSPEDIRGGTFSVVDLGGYGVDTFTPLILAPQCAVLGLGRIALMPSVYQGQVAPRHRLGLSLTFDHRIVDGAPAARFLKAIGEYVEQPYLWLFR